MKRLALALLLVLVACRSVPVKQAAVITTSAVEHALAVAQDAERALCFVTPAVEAGPICTNPAAVTVKWSNEQHVAFEQALSKAFGIQKVLAPALKNWHPGDPPPASLSALLKAAQDALNFAMAVSGQTATALFVSDVQKLVDEIKVLQGRVR